MIIKDLFIGNFRISQLFGKNPQMYAKFGLKGHNGIDFATPTGTQLVCCFDEAEVITAEDDKTGYGKHIKLWDKKQQIVAIYGHCKELLVKVGDTVKFGNLIAISNNTGFSTGPHLHFGVCKVDKNCKRLNTNNGYSGWINPLEDFVWETENLKKPIEESGIIDDMTTEEKNLLKIIKEAKLNEGDIRWLADNISIKNNDTVKKLEEEIAGYKKANNELADKVSIQGEEIYGLKGTISDLYKDLEKKQLQIGKMTDEFSKLQAEYKDLSKSKPELALSDCSARHLFILFIKKLFK